jgi:hypothetical protein
MENAVIFLFVSMGITCLVGALVGAIMFWKEMRNR